MDLYMVADKKGHWEAAVFTRKADAIAWAEVNGHEFVDRITANEPNTEENVWERPDHVRRTQVPEYRNLLMPGR